ncbi:ABC transporter ATP-binding protein, partial [Sinorhizobium meliloti]
MPTINLRGAQKNYGVNSANAVSNLDLEIRDGEFMCLLGPSGCGKTTTLRMIAGLENLSGGEIRIGERVVDCVTGGVFVPPEKREMGLVFQSYALWPHLTIERNTDFGLRLRKLPKAEREERVERIMQALDIAKYRDRYPSQLSGGQQQRVALARMLAINPGVLLLDEPLSNLDARLRLEMRAELKRLHKEFKTTIVFVTHDQWEAMTLATTIAVMNEGTLQQMGTPNDIYDRPANRFVAEFVGSPP